jgi:hypothetical protein
MSSRNGSHKGLLVAAVLAGSWRSSNYPPLEITEDELEEITPLLCQFGAAALAWRRLRETTLADSAAADALRQSYRHQSLKSELHQQQVEKVFRTFRERQIEAILFKGWAASTLYYQNDLRPPGDIDVIVRAEEFARAQEVLRSSEARDCNVDLHKELEEIPDRSFNELFARSRVLPLGDQSIRILGPEDHLALLCIHLLKHGAWRPLWLCDVSAGVESTDRTFDWNICFGQSATRRGWILAAISLARVFLKADTSSCPATVPSSLPSWLTESVLRQWSDPRLIDRAPLNHPVPMSQVLRRREGLIEGLRQRWPNPILATISVNGEI